MNQEMYKQHKAEFDGFMQKMACDRVCFRIEHDKKGKRYTISVSVFRRGTVAEIPASMFPKFNNVMYAYIFCVGMIHTAYSQEQIMFISENKAIYEEICRLQSDNEDDAEYYAKEAAAMRQHSNRPTGKTSTPKKSS